jgi:hypothetical protein
MIFTRTLLSFFLGILVVTAAACFRSADGVPLADRTLESQEIIQGIPCTGAVTYFNNGALESAITAEDVTFNGHFFPAGSRLTFQKDSTLSWCFLARASELEGVLCKGESHDYINASIRTDISDLPGWRAIRSSRVSPVWGQASGEMCSGAASECILPPMVVSSRPRSPRILTFRVGLFKKETTWHSIRWAFSSLLLTERPQSFLLSSF